MVPMTRIERVTSPLPRECSTTEPHGLTTGPNQWIKIIYLVLFFLPTIYYLLLFTYYFYFIDSIAILNTGAGEGNRTLVVSLEGFCSTIELHPLNTTYRVSFLVERVGFEPT